MATPYSNRYGPRKFEKFVLTLDETIHYIKSGKQRSLIKRANEFAIKNYSSQFTDKLINESNTTESNVKRFLDELGKLDVQFFNKNKVPVEFLLAYLSIFIKYAPEKPEIFSSIARQFKNMLKTNQNLDKSVLNMILPLIITKAPYDQYLLLELMNCIVDSFGIENMTPVIAELLVSYPDYKVLDFLKLFFEGIDFTDADAKILYEAIKKIEEDKQFTERMRLNSLKLSIEKKPDKAMDKSPRSPGSPSKRKSLSRRSSIINMNSKIDDLVDASGDENIIKTASQQDIERFFMVATNLFTNSLKEKEVNILLNLMKNINKYADATILLSLYLKQAKEVENLELLEECYKDFLLISGDRLNANTPKSLFDSNDNNMEDRVEYAITLFNNDSTIYDGVILLANLINDNDKSIEAISEELKFLRLFQYYYLLEGLIVLNEEKPSERLAHAIKVIKSYGRSFGKI